MLTSTLALASFLKISVTLIARLGCLLAFLQRRQLSTLSSELNWRC